MTAETSQDGLIAELRAADPDRLYMALMASGTFRARLIGLFAFNLEIAATRERVSEPMLGQIRLQWWRDALEEIRSGTPREHPVAVSLASWLPEAGEPGFHFAKRLVDAREADLEDQPFEQTSELMDYADATAGNVARLAALACGVKDKKALEAAGLAGTAYGLAGILRATPFLGAQGRVMLPGTLLARHGIADARQSLGRRDPEKLRAALSEIASLAEDRLMNARRTKRVPKAARPALAHAPLARLYLERLRKAGCDLADPRLDPGTVPRILTLFRHQILG